MALQGFDEAYYLSAKLAALAAVYPEWATKTTVDLKAYLANVGFTPESHYSQFGYTEGLAPNAYFNHAEYKMAKAQQLFDANLFGSLSEALAAFEAAWTGDAYLHYLQYGASEGINPSNDFDASSYLEDKLAQLQAADAETYGDWTAADVLEAFAQAGFTPLTHYLEFGQSEGLTVTAVPAGEQVSPDEQIPTVGETFMLTKGLDNVPGTSGNDTIIGSIATAAGSEELNTISSLDIVNGGAGVDTLKIATADTNSTVTLPNLSNVEIIELQGLGTGGVTTLAAKSVAGLTDINVTKMAESITVEAAAATNVDVTLQAAAQNDVIVDGGNNVTVKLTDVEDDGAGDGNDITIGTGVTAPKGDVVVEATAKAAADGVDIVMGAIDITGGKTINVTQKVGDISGLAAGETAPDHAQGDVTIVAAATTTDITVKQDLAATANDAVAGVAGVREVVSVKFVAMAANDTMILSDGANTLTFTAGKALTAAQVATAFANLNADAILPTNAVPSTATGDTNGGSASANGVFSGDGLADWSSAAASGDTVVFTAKTAGTTGLVDGGGVKTAVPTITTAAVTEVDAEAAVLGVTAGVVDITGGAALATVTVDSYSGASQIQGATNNALATVNLSNGVNFDIASAASSLALNLTNVTGSVDVAAGTTTLNATVTTNSTTAATLASASATTVNVSGTGRVAGTTATGLTAATAINTTGMTAGAATFTIADGTATSYTGGAAVDSVTVSNAGTAITKAIDLGAGDDTLTLTGAPVVVPTATLKGGAGTDTLAMSATSAAALDGATTFAAKLDSFERLTINDAGAGETILLDNLGFQDYVTVSGGTLTLDNLAANATVVMSAAATSLTAILEDASGDADVLNAVISNTAGINVGDLVVNDVETVNLTVTDTTTAAIGTHTLNFDADTATTLNISGNAGLNLTLDANTTLLATIDASGMTGSLNVAAMDTALEMTITGGSGDDTLQASGVSKSTIYGGEGDDTIVAGTVSSDLYGGAGNDLFVLKDLAGDGTGGSKDADSYSIIRDFQAGDVLQLVATDALGAADDSVSGEFTKLVTTLQDDTASLASFVGAAMKQIFDDGAVVGDAVWFNYKGHAYIVMDNGTATADGTFTAGEDLVIRLLGVDGNNLSFNSDYGTVALA